VPDLDIDVTAAADDDVPAIAAMLARAFADDPMVMWPLGAGDPSRPVTNFLELNRVFVRLGIVWKVGDVDGAAVWVPPDRLEGYLEAEIETRPPIVALTDDGGRRYHALWDWIGSMIPDDDLWFLDQVGVDPAKQGSGIGSALVRFGLGRARSDGRGAFLETAIGRNVPYYEEFGFRVAAHGDAPLGGPHVWFMRADP
jgi:GNAT superfamily N-acetyltransferase